MKHLLIIFVLILPFKTIPQEKTLDSFMDIKWGSSVSTVIKKMKQKENVNLVSSTDTLVVMRDGTFAGRDVWTWQLHFWKDQFYWASLYLSVKTPIYIDDIFYSLLGDISQKYGKPTYYDSTAYDYDDRKAIWVLDKNNKQKDKCIILLAINSDPFFWIVLGYQNSSIYEKKIQFEKRKKTKSLDEI